jgi:hypothetical protein
MDIMEPRDEGILDGPLPIIEPVVTNVVKERKPRKKIPCKEDQEDVDGTCRKKCTDIQIRDPDTKRCRKPDLKKGRKDKTILFV